MQLSNQTHPDPKEDVQLDIETVIPETEKEPLSDGNEEVNKDEDAGEDKGVQENEEGDKRDEVETTSV